MKWLVRLFLVTIIFIASSSVVHAQFVDGTKGLLCMPSAEFDAEATFKITNNFLNEAYLPDYSTYAWDKQHTFNYAFSITLWSRFEIAYVCTLMDTWVDRGGPVKLFNQDRHFSAKILLLRENEFGKKWIPALAVGAIDPLTQILGNYSPGNVGQQGTGLFNKYYIVATKHFNTPVGDIGGHLGFQYTMHKAYQRTGPIAAVTWNPRWLNNGNWFMNAFRVTTEWDAMSFNIGINASFWKDRFELMAMLYGCRYPQVGLRYKLKLSH